MKNGPDLKMLLLGAVGLSVIGGGTVFWLSNVAGGAKNRVAQLEREVPEEDRLRSDVRDATTELEAIQAKLEHLEQGVPGQAYVPTLLTELESLGNQNQVKVTGVRPIIQGGARKKKEPKNAKKQAYEELNIDITGTGTYQSVMQMIDALQKFQKVVAVQTVSLTPIREGGANKVTSGPTKLEAVVRIKAFLFSNPEEAPEESGGDA